MDNKIVYVDTKTPEKVKEKFDITKLLTIKNLKLLILAIVLLIVIIVFWSASSKTTSSTIVTSSKSYGYTSTLEYCAELERKLQEVLSNVKGAGQVKVMITVDGSPELVYAKEEDAKVSSNSAGTTTSSSSASPIIVTTGGESNALILTENLPEVKGVIVVSSGAKDVSIKMDILNAVSTLLNIDMDKVSVLQGI